MQQAFGDRSCSWPCHCHQLLFGGTPKNIEKSIIINTYVWIWYTITINYTYLIYMIFLLYTWLYNAQIGRNISIPTSVYIWYRKKTSNQKRLHRHLITWYVRILELAESSLRSFGSIDSTSAFWFFWIVTPQKDRNNLLLGFYMHDFTFLSF